MGFTLTMICLIRAYVNGKPPFYHKYCVLHNGFHFDNSQLLTRQIDIANNKTYGLAYMNAMNMIYYG